MSLNLLGGILSSIRQDVKELLIIGLILLTLVALVYVFIKFEQTRAWIGSLIVFVVFCTSLISGYKIYQYFTATGGTVGDVISSIFGSSNAEKVGDYSFKFNNLVFKSTANENEYKATYQDIYSNEIGSFDLDMTKNWNIYVNDDSTTNCVVGNNYVFADYIYTFYNEDLKEIFIDSLKIKFVFYNNYYQIDLITTKGETATEFWQSYFVKDSIVISLKESSDNNDKSLSLNQCIFTLSLSADYSPYMENAYNDFAITLTDNEKKSHTVDFGPISQYYSKDITLESKRTIVLPFGSYSCELICNDGIVNVINNIKTIILYENYQQLIIQIVIRPITFTFIDEVSEGVSSFDYYGSCLVNLTAKTYDGYEFIGWYVNDECISMENSFEYVTPSVSATITAKYKKLDN